MQVGPVHSTMEHYDWCLIKRNRLVSCPSGLFGLLDWVCLNIGSERARLKKCKFSMRIIELFVLKGQI